MSHIVTIQTEVRDPIAVAAACHRLSLAAPVNGVAKLYSGEAAGLLVQLPEWIYPVACQTELGVLVFDNFEGRWGDHVHLDHFVQAYAVEKAKLEARWQGHSVFEQPLADGSIKLTIQVGGQG